MTNKTYTLKMPAEILDLFATNEKVNRLIGRKFDYSKLEYNMSNPDRNQCIFYACGRYLSAKYHALKTLDTSYNESMEMYHRIGNTETEFEIYDGDKLAVRLFIMPDWERLDRSAVVAQMDAKIREYELGLPDYDYNPELHISPNGLDWDNILHRRGEDCFYVFRGEALEAGKALGFPDLETDERYWDLWDRLFDDSAIEADWKFIVDSLEGLEK